MRSPLPGTGPQTSNGAMRRRSTRRPADDAPADGARADAVLTTPEQRAAAHRLYRDSVDRTYVDHTYDVMRIEAGEDAGSQDSQHSHDPQPPESGEEGARRDADAERASARAARRLTRRPQTRWIRGRGTRTASRVRQRRQRQRTRRRGMRGLRRSPGCGPSGRNTSGSFPSEAGRLPVLKPTGAGWATVIGGSLPSRTRTRVRPARTSAPRAGRSSGRRWSGWRPLTRDAVLRGWSTCSRAKTG